MPQDHPGLARSSLGHKKVTVDTPTFERMVSDGGMSCYFHVFDNPAPSELGPATEGQVTSAILTTDNRDTSPERGACPVFRSHSILAMTPCSGHSNSSDVLSADSYSFPQMPVVHNLDEALLCIPEKSALEKRLITESLVHPSLGVRNSAPSSFGPEMMQSTLRNTYYFGFLDKTLHQSFQESNGVVVLLVPELAARQMYAKCSGRYPNVFVAACETRHQVGALVSSYAWQVKMVSILSIVIHSSICCSNFCIQWSLMFTCFAFSGRLLFETSSWAIVAHNLAPYTAWRMHARILYLVVVDMTFHTTCAYEPWLNKQY